MRDGDAVVRVTRDLAVVVEPSRSARVRLLVDWNAVRCTLKKAPPNCMFQVVCSIHSAARGLGYNSRNLNSSFVLESCSENVC